MKVRIISGVVGGILAILILILHKTFVFPLAIAALICIALFELFRAGKCLHCRISIGAGFLYGAALPFLQYYGNTSATIALTFLCIVAMFAEMVLLHKHITYQNTLFIAAITLLVSHSLSMLNTLLHISQFGLASVILALSSAWIADTGAYFAGNCRRLFRWDCDGCRGNGDFCLDLQLDRTRTCTLSLADFYWHCLCCNQRTGRFECICTEASAGNQRLRKYHARTRRCHGSF